MQPAAIALLDLLAQVCKSCPLDLCQFLAEALSSARSTTAINNLDALIIVLSVHYGVSIANAEAIFKALKDPSLTYAAFQEALDYYFSQESDYRMAWYAGDVASKIEVYSQAWDRRADINPRLLQLMRTEIVLAFPRHQALELIKGLAPTLDTSSILGLCYNKIYRDDPLVLARGNARPGRKAPRPISSKPMRVQQVAIDPILWLECKDYAVGEPAYVQTRIGFFPTVLS